MRRSLLVLATAGLLLAARAVTGRPPVDDGSQWPAGEGTDAGSDGDVGEIEVVASDPVTIGSEVNGAWFGCFAIWPSLPTRSPRMPRRPGSGWRAGRTTGG